MRRCWSRSTSVCWGWATTWSPDTYRDLRPYLFPGMDVDGPLPMMPNKRDNWSDGFISQYNGLREAGRYAKYHGLRLRPDPGEGRPGHRLHAGWLYLSNHFDKDKQMLGRIYEAIGWSHRGRQHGPADAGVQADRLQRHVSTRSWRHSNDRPGADRRACPTTWQEHADAPGCSSSSAQGSTLAGTRRCLTPRRDHRISGITFDGD